MTLSLVSIFPITNAFAVAKEENEKYKNFLENECTRVGNYIYKRDSDGKYFGRSSNTASDDVFAPNLRVGGSDYKQVTGLQTIDGKKYYFNKYGALYIGWKRTTDPTVDTSNMSAYEKTKHLVWYYYGEDGAIKEGWINYQGNWYYIYSDGLMAQNTTTPDVV